MPKPMTAEKLKAIWVRCEAARNTPEGPYRVTDIDSIVYQGKKHSRPVAQMVKGDLTRRELNALSALFAHARQDLPACLDEIERLRGVLQGVLTKHNFLQYWSKDQACECDPDVGMSPCMKHAASDIINMITKALAGEEAKNEL